MLTQVMGSSLHITPVVWHKSSDFGTPRVGFESGRLSAAFSSIQLTGISERESETRAETCGPRPVQGAAGQAERALYGTRRIPNGAAIRHPGEVEEGRSRRRGPGTSFSRPLWRGFLRTGPRVPVDYVQSSAESIPVPGAVEDVVDNERDRPFKLTHSPPRSPLERLA